MSSLTESQQGTENEKKTEESDQLIEMTKKGLEFLSVFAENRIVTEYELIVPFN